MTGPSCGEPEHALVHRRAAAVQVLHESLQSAGVLEHIALVLALIVQLDAHAGVQERQFAQPLGQRLVDELDVGEDLAARPEADAAAALGARADVSKRSDGSPR